MKYADGQVTLAGDVVLLDSRSRGTVIAATGDESYLPGQDAWASLGRGSVIDTDFGGLVHYPDMGNECVVLIRRRGPE